MNSETRLDRMKQALQAEMAKRCQAPDEIKANWRIMEAAIQTILSNPTTYDLDENARQGFRQRLAEQGIEVSPEELQTWFEGRQQLAELCRRFGLI